MNNTGIERTQNMDIESLVKIYEDGSFNDKDVLTWETWYTLAKHFRMKGKNKESYECAIKGLQSVVPIDKKLLLYEEVAITAFYLGYMKEGYEACERVILSSYAEHQTRNSTINNQQFYMTKLPFKTVHNITHPFPETYIGSSSSIVPYGDGFVMNVRCVNYTITNTGSYIIRDPQQIIRTRNYLLFFNKDLRIGKGMELEDTSDCKRYPKDFRGMEDIRLILGCNAFLCTYPEINNSSIPQMCYCEYDISTGKVTKVLPLMIGSELKPEKNWIPIIINSEVYLIYSISPCKIYKLNVQTGQLELMFHLLIEEPDINLSEFRGSGGMIPYKNGWLGTIHQVHYNNRRKYFHRFIWFNHDLTVMKYSRIFYFESPNIEYNLSVCQSPTGLLVPYSVCDNSTKLGILEYDVLDSLFPNGLI